jgi:hypothetical protein
MTVSSSKGSAAWKHLRTAVALAWHPGEGSGVPNASSMTVSSKGSAAKQHLGTVALAWHPGESNGVINGKSMTPLFGQERITRSQ